MTDRELIQKFEALVEWIKSHKPGDDRDNHLITCGALLARLARPKSELERAIDEQGEE